MFTKTEDQSLRLVLDLISTSHILEKQNLLLLSRAVLLFSLYGNLTMLSNERIEYVKYINIFKLMVD